MAVLAGASGPTAIAKWAGIKAEFLLKVLELPNGIPCKDVFRRVLMSLQPGAFQSCFVKWLEWLVPAAQATGVQQPVLAVDGKTRGGAMIAARRWGLCIASPSGPANLGCRWGKWRARRNRTKSRQFPSFCDSWTSRARSSRSTRWGHRRRSRSNHRQRSGLCFWPERKPRNAARHRHRPHRPTKPRRRPRSSTAHHPGEGHGREEKRSIFKCRCRKTNGNFGRACSRSA